jgi:hypothetical protein
VGERGGALPVAAATAAAIAVAVMEGAVSDEAHVGEWHIFGGRVRRGVPLPM